MCTASRYGLVYLALAALAPAGAWAQAATDTSSPVRPAPAGAVVGDSSRRLDTARTMVDTGPPRTVDAAGRIDSAAAPMRVGAPPADTSTRIGGATGADTLSVDTAAGRQPGGRNLLRPGQDSSARVSAMGGDSAARRDSVAPRAAPPPDDTSLTARMDVRRGGGLKRAEFPDLLETARLSGRYRTFLRLVDRAGWRARLSNGTYTLFAPTDSAFAALPTGALERLAGDSLRLQRWIAARVAPGTLLMRELVRTGASAPTVGGETIRVERDSAGRLTSDGVQVVQPDVVARNGVLQGVGAVTLP